MKLDYKNINRKAWNNRVATHFTSEFYDVEGWKAGKNSLNEIELELLGKVAGKSILHLQCHFGQDSLSLARMGAIVTGVNLSDQAIGTARELNNEMELNAEFIVSDVLDFIGKMDTKFDIVFTSYGTIGWLPDLNKWAEVISHYLKPNGKLVFVEFHPIVWMFDEHFETVQYRYFKDKAIIETSTGTYADTNSEIEKTEISWNHGIGEVFQNLKNHGLQLLDFKEYDYSPYDCFEGMKKVADRKYIIEKHANKLPLVYSLVARKSGS
ncbi:MAG: class I SAM-dependent methyltransferase [Flavobacteriales bacterium]|nr:class I SAM-dependent methyltransferase [Flavobacteriales bacterium]